MSYALSASNLGVNGFKTPVATLTKGYQKRCENSGANMPNAVQWKFTPTRLDLTTPAFLRTAHRCRGPQWVAVWSHPLGLS